MKDPMFDEVLIKAELSAWQSMKSVITNFLRNHQSAKYEKEIEELLRMVGWLFGFYGISTFVGYLMPNPFLNK